MAHLEPASPNPAESGSQDLDSQNASTNSGFTNSGLTNSDRPNSNCAKTPRTSRSAPKSRSENPWIEGIKTIGLSALLAFGIRTFVAEARYVPTGSMLPTIEVNDRLLIDKVGYRFESPKRGDIVVFNPTDVLAEQNFTDAFIKRVVGLPGETVEVRNGIVLIDGQPLEEDYISEAPDYQWGPEIVPEDQYVVLGDNRNNSMDSHVWGFVPRHKIIGRAVVRFWPPDRLGGVEPLENPDKHPEDLPYPEVDTLPDEAALR